MKPPLRKHPTKLTPAQRAWLREFRKYFGMYFWLLHEGSYGPAFYMMIHERNKWMTLVHGMKYAQVHPQHSTTTATWREHRYLLHEYLVNPTL